MAKTTVTAALVSLLASFMAHARPPVVGAEQPSEYMPLLRGKHVALVCNHTARVGKVHLLDFLLKEKVKVIRIFAPEHGFRGKQAAGDTVLDAVDKESGIPLFSLYGKRMKPPDHLLEDIDVVVFDIQDVGCRFYTYITLLFLVQEACAQTGTQLLVLDRPNPNGDYIAGHIPNMETHKTYISYLPVPVVHGCTVGELAQMYNGQRWLANQLKAELTVVTVKNYTHNTPYSLPVSPSPNLPNDLAVRLYPSLCLFEATQLSIGRGTDKPFQVIGYPDTSLGTFKFIPRSLKGIAENAKHQGDTCYGENLQGKELPRYTTAFLHDYFKKMKAANLPFIKSRYFLDCLIGSDTVYDLLQKGQSAAQIDSTWQTELAAYQKMRKKYLLYPDFK